MWARDALLRSLRSVRDAVFRETTPRKRRRRSGNVDDDDEDVEEEDDNVLDTLPVEVHFLILSYLSPRDLCMLGGCSRYWRALVREPLLWRYFLMRDVPTWTSVDHLSMPSLQAIAALVPDMAELPELDFMAEYLRCCPACRGQWQRHHRHHHVQPAYKVVTSFLQSLVSETELRFAMFGPGLEQLDVSLVTSMMHSPHVLPIAGIPQRHFNGIGSGITFAYKNQHKFNMITLYSTNSTERERARVEGQSVVSKLFVQQGELGSGDVGRRSYSVAPQVQQVCQDVDGFIFVANAEAESVRVCREEECAQLGAVLQPVWGPASRPVLVLSCVSRETACRSVCVCVAQQLQLHLLHNPWMVQDVAADSLSGLLEGVDWLLRHSGVRM